MVAACGQDMVAGGGSSHRRICDGFSVGLMEPRVINATWEFAALGLVLLALALLLVWRNREKYVSGARIALWIQTWRAAVMEKDRDKFNALLIKYFGDSPGDLKPAISVLPRNGVMALIHELLELDYEGDCARRAIAKAYGREQNRPTLPFGRRNHLLNADAGVHIAQYREEIVPADREKFDSLLRQYIGEPLTDIAAKIDALPQATAFALLFSLMQLEYRPESAGRTMAVAKQGDFEKLGCRPTKAHPNPYGIEEMRNEVVATDKEGFEATLKEFLGEPLDHLHERIGLLTGQELANLYVRLMEFRYNQKDGDQKLAVDGATRESH